MYNKTQRRKFCIKITFCSDQRLSSFYGRQNVELLMKLISCHDETCHDETYNFCKYHILLNFIQMTIFTSSCVEQLYFFLTTILISHFYDEYMFIPCA